MKVDGKTWIFCSPYYVRLSKMKVPAMLSWGIYLEKNDPLTVRACNDHDDHHHLASFYLTNEELLSYYEAIMNSGAASER